MDRPTARPTGRAGGRAWPLEVGGGVKRAGYIGASHRLIAQGAGLGGDIEVGGEVEGEGAGGEE